MAKILQVIDVDSGGHKVRLDDGRMVFMPHGGQHPHIGEEVSIVDANAHLGAVEKALFTEEPLTERDFVSRVDVALEDGTFVRVAIPGIHVTSYSGPGEPKPEATIEKIFTPEQFSEAMQAIAEMPRTNAKLEGLSNAVDTGLSAESRQEGEHAEEKAPVE